MADNDVTTDVSNVVVYFDVNTGNLYNANGDLYGNNTLSTFLDNNFTLELHYVKDTTISSDPTQWEKWDGLDGQSVSSTLAFDNDFIHAVEGTATEDTTAAATKLSVNVPNINKDTLATSGILVIDPFNSYIQDIPTEDKIVSYSSFEYITGTTFSFTLEDSDGLPFDVAANTPVRVADPVYILVNSNEIYEKNIPEQYDEGIFNIPIHAISKKLLKALDYSNSSGVTGTMEHKIYVNRQSLAGVSFTTGQYSDVTMTRSKDGDTVAQDVAYYAWTYNDGNTRLYYTKNKIPVLNEKVYKKTDDDRIIEANGSVVSDSSTASETVIKIGTGTAVTCPKATGSDEYAPYLFCYWTGDKNGTSVTCYTKGNDISVGSLTYTISGGTATETANTVDPVFDTGYVLHRTFSFPFIVKNLIDYNVSLNIPVENTDWVRAYVISIVKTNMEEIVARASTAAFGVVKVGTNIDVSNGVISVKTASTSNKGLVKVGTNIDVAEGTISVKDASTDNKGLIEIATSAEVTAGESAILAVTPATLKVELDKKQDNLSAVEPVVLNDNTVSLNYNAPLYKNGSNLALNFGDGLAIGAEGSTNENKLIVNEASVKEVLEDVVDSGTEPAVNEIVTADNLKGALSVGQAVDVSCPALANNFTNISIDGGQSWQAITQDLVKQAYLGDFIIEKTTGTSCYFGFTGTTTSYFPKYASNLKYLFIFDFKITGKSSLGVYWHNPPTGGADGKLFNGSSSTWTRAYIILETPRFYISCNSYTTPLRIEFKNWRQYEVTALTDEAIAYIAQLENPDAFFRSTDVSSIRDKYLIKQDMVCPWIKTINMPDNSDLTVAAGLSYKIKYTNNNIHTITADTIPTNAYGWDTHIQMFIKGTSSIQFQEPLILMDALTPNAGHNLIVKYRNGDALVYVDDTNAGNIVLYATGTTAGTLNYFLQQDPGSGQDNYIIFAVGTDGSTCEAGDVTVAYNTDLLGNGTDKTTITGNISVTSGKTINFQSLTISGSTLSGTDSNVPIHLNNIVLNNVQLTGSTSYYIEDVIVPAGSTVGGESYVFSHQGTTNLQMDGFYTTEFGFLAGSITGEGVFDASIQVGRNISGSSYTILIEGVTCNQNFGQSCYLNGANAESRKTYATVKDFTYNAHNRIYSSGAAFIISYNNDVVFDNITCIQDYQNYGNFVLFLSTSTSKLTIKSFKMPQYLGAIANYGGTLIVDGYLQYSGHLNTNGVKASKIIFLSGSTIDMYNSDNPVTNTSYTPYQKGIGTISIGDNITFIWNNGDTGFVDACTVTQYNNKKYLYDLTITGSTANPWKATNITFASPLDAAETDTIKLTGTAFTSASKTLNTNRIQLPAGSTNSFQGNTNAADTKILDASLIVVGDDSASPSGSATVVNASGTSSTVTGIGTYIDKEGDNDFVANNTTNVVAVDDSTTGAKYLGTVLSATTGDTGANRFAKIDSGAVAVVNEATNAVNKQIITHDYGPIIGGTFSLTSATVDESTKTVAIQSGGRMDIVDVTCGKDSVIDLGGTNVNIPSGATASVNGCTITGGSAAYGGAFSGNIVLFNCTVSGNIAGGGTEAIYGRFTLMGGNVINGGMYIANGQSVIRGSNTVTRIAGSVYGSLTIASGAIVDLTGNTNPTPIAPGGGITFEQGGATVRLGSSAGTVDSSYMMDNVTLPAGAKLTNTAEVKFGGNQWILPSNAVTIISGCTITSAAVADDVSNTFAISIPSGASLTLTDTIITGCTVGHASAMNGAVIGDYGTLTLNRCTLKNNTSSGGATAVDIRIGGSVIITDCDIGAITTYGNWNGTFSGKNNKLKSLYSYDLTNVQRVTISSGCSIQLSDYIDMTSGLITVKTGGCTVNGTYINEGNYTKITSSGGSAVVTSASV